MVSRECGAVLRGRRANGTVAWCGGLGARREGGAVRGMSCGTWMVFLCRVKSDTFPVLPRFMGTLGGGKFVWRRPGAPQVSWAGVPLRRGSGVVTAAVRTNGCRGPLQAGDRIMGGRPATVSSGEACQHVEDALWGNPKQTRGRNWARMTVGLGGWVGEVGRGEGRERWEEHLGDEAAGGSQGGCPERGRPVGKGSGSFTNGCAGRPEGGGTSVLLAGDESLHPAIILPSCAAAGTTSWYVRQDGPKRPEQQGRALQEIISVGRQVGGRLRERSWSLRREVAPVTNAGPR